MLDDRMTEKVELSRNTVAGVEMTGVMREALTDTIHTMAETIGTPIEEEVLERTPLMSRK